MGGPGSGNFYRWRGKKATVEESLVVSVGTLRGRLVPGAAGTVTWTTGGVDRSAVGYAVDGSADAPRVIFDYRWRDAEDVRLSVWLEASPMRFGGRRWWFVCPLVVNGRACNRRACKLYLPPGGRYFGCRTCHRLTYRSAQEAHQAERVFGKLGMDAESIRLLSLKRPWMRG